VLPENFDLAEKHSNINLHLRGRWQKRPWIIAEALIFHIQSEE
jgi:hypothetical protein